MNLLYYDIVELYNMQRTELDLLDEQPVVLVVGRHLRPCVCVCACVCVCSSAYVRVWV